MIFFLYPWKSKDYLKKTSKLQEPFQENAAPIWASIFGLQLYKEGCKFWLSIIVDLLFEVV